MAIAPLLYRVKEILFLTICLPFELQVAFVLTGMTLMTYAVIVDALGRISRGANLSKENPELATKWGHAIVRHPQYAMYIVCFIGLPFVSLSPYLLVLLLGKIGRASCRERV